jgi:hypothetical protein
MPSEKEINGRDEGRIEQRRYRARDAGITLG